MRVGWLGAVVALLLVAPAWAQALRVQMVTKVREGQNPSIRVTADSESTETGISLTRSDGKNLFFRIGTLHSGETHEIQLDGTPGKFRYEGTLTGKIEGSTDEVPLEFTTIVAPPLRIELDRAKVNLEKRQLELKLSRTAGHVKVKVLGAGGSVIAERDHDFAGKPAGTPLKVKWSASGSQEVVRIEIRAYDEDGFYSGVALTPWSVKIPHQQVNFETDKAIIRDSEKPKLEDSYAKITQALREHREIEGVKLFIAGHTDTVGSAAYNLNLSRKRALAIANWFRKRGLSIPVLAEGFGEYALLVKTGDNTDEPRNRRVDYILAVEEPPIKVTAGYRGGWKQVQ
jgi:outer membrane protein OmpA-like peptidoglycan-associated protein